MAETSNATNVDRPPPSRSRFAASRVEERVTHLESKMELVHLYCFATAPRDIQNNSMALGNLLSRLDGLEKHTTDEIDIVNVQLKILDGQLRGIRHAPLQTEPCQTGGNSAW